MRIVKNVVIKKKGACLRYLFAQLNPKFPKFPLGTFLVNMLGVAILAAMYVVKQDKNMFTGGSTTSSYVVTGISTGFCGKCGGGGKS